MFIKLPRNIEEMLVDSDRWYLWFIPSTKDKIVAKR